MSDSAVDKFQPWDEVKVIIDTHLKIWAMFITWFSWFFGINVAAMAYIVVLDKPVRPAAIMPLCSFMFGCVLIGLTSSYFMNIYTKQTVRRIKSIHTAASKRDSHLFDASTIMGNPVLQTSGLLISMSLFWTLLAWIFIGAWALNYIPRLPALTISGSSTALSTSGGN